MEKLWKEKELYLAKFVDEVELEKFAKEDFTWLQLKE